MKKIIILAITGLMLMGIVACTNQKSEKTENIKESTKIETESKTDEPLNNIENNTDDNNLEKYSADTEGIAIGEVITAGEIMEFKENYVAIITGDIVESYEFDKKQINDFYIGQNVEIIKAEKSNQLKALLIENFENRYTSMGDLLEQFSGTLTNITEENIKIKSEDKEIEISLYSPIDYKIGNHVSVYYFSYSADEKASLFDIYNEDTKLELVVNNITRTEKGHMQLEMKDSKNETYVVDASNCYLELNLSEIKIGDTLEIYHKGTSEKSPTKVKATLIKK